ncbi:hypothetical protein [Streptomyces sp. AP-93]|uniref:hypothetical protein n=1 Tax=Streptomyces sp. AP-93 TaxID=2929048 RepID=UPI001FAFE539|nr:hypothetical protein [Streptomyces sp. AP-93]MCJ0871375.1 hypothetical protein [Streptomyces sp. AP-93]
MAAGFGEDGLGGGPGPVGGTVAPAGPGAEPGGTGGTADTATVEAGSTVTVAPVAEAVPTAEVTHTAAVPPAAEPDPRPPGRMRRWRQRFAAASLANRIAAAGLALALVPLLTPVVKAGYEAVLGGDPLTVIASPDNDPCHVGWFVAPSHEELRASLSANMTADGRRSLDRWVREGWVTHQSAVGSRISVYGNKGGSVQLRDFTITVKRRGAPLPWAVTTGAACGGDSIPLLYVDLDTLPVGVPVSYRYLQSSPQQAAARAKGMGEELTLPYELRKDSYFAMQLVGRTLAHYTEWQATLTWWDGERLHTTQLTDQGRPFRVSAGGSAASAPTP